MTLYAATVLPRLVTTTGVMLNLVWEVVEETAAGFLIVTPYPQQGPARPLSVVPVPVTIPYVQKSRWIDITSHCQSVQLKDGTNIIDAWGKTVAVLVPGYRMRKDAAAHWLIEQEEKHLTA